MIGYELAHILGIHHQAPDELVVATFMRLAGRTTDGRSASPGAARWIGEVAGKLAEHTGYDFRDRTQLDLTAIAKADAAAMVPQPKRSDAVSALGVIAPSAVIPAGTPAEIERAARALVGQYLPGVCEKVLTEWAREGKFADPYDTGRLDP